MNRKFLTGALMALTMTTTSLAQSASSAVGQAPAVGAAATATGAATANQKNAPSASTEKKICKSLEASGTRLLKRACLTKEEWKQVEREVEG